MATMSLSFDLHIIGAFFEIDRINPRTSQIELSDGRSTRRILSLSDGVPVSLDPGDITPKRWFFANDHAQNALVISLSGSGDDIVLEPGRWSFIESGVVPVAQGRGGASRLIYAALSA